MSMQRTCIISFRETKISAPLGAVSTIPGAASHGFPNVPINVTKWLVMQAPYDAIFKDAQKAVPGARFHGTEKIWFVDLTGASTDKLLAVFSYLSSGGFIMCARDRQMTLEWSLEINTLGSFTVGSGSPSIFNWLPASRQNGAFYRIEPHQMDAALAYLSGHGGPRRSYTGPYIEDEVGTIPKDAYDHFATKANAVFKDATPADEVGLDEAIVQQAGSYVEPDTVAEQELLQIPEPYKTSYEAWLTSLPDGMRAPDGTEREFYTCQRNAFAFIMARIEHMFASKPTAGIATVIAHDPGQGKTMTGVAFAHLYPFTKFKPGSVPDTVGRLSEPIGKVVVICPERARTTWRREFTKFTRREVYRYGLDDKAGARWSESKHGVLIVGYSSVIKESFVDKLGKPPFDGNLLIVDECHYLTNRKSKRTIAVQQIANRFLHRLFLSGTPMLAKPVELYPVLNIANPDMFSNYWRYTTRYCGAKKSKFGWEVDGKSNVKELTGYLRYLMHRARRSGSGLPPINRIPVPIDIEDRAELDDAVAGAIAGLSMIPGAGAHASEVRAKGNLSVSATIRQLVYNSRRDETIEWLVDWAKGSPGRKMLIFCWNREVVADVVNGLTGGLQLHPQSIIGVTGDVSIAERDNVAKRFNEDGKVRFLVTTIGAMGDVYSLHERCNDGAFVQYDWTPGVMKQAELRLGRAKSGDAVNWYYLCAANTVDERMLMRLLEKQKTFGEIIDGGVTTPDYDEVLQEILAWKGLYDSRHAPRNRRRAAH